MRTALKNADAMLKRIMKEVDTNGDGKIQYEGALSTVLALTQAWACVLLNASPLPLEALQTQATYGY